MTTRTEAFVWFLALLALACAAVTAGHIGLCRVETALALQCARASVGTDAAIVDCYTTRGLPAPEGLK